ncbi:MAG: MotA/TolQ/ExbB proton channel family protein [Cohaesibacter sp.]|nr:MotA/TolQ/ExbB proton channel family protein [Cohaesibacter sp.]
MTSSSFSSHASFPQLAQASQTDASPSLGQDPTTAQGLSAPTEPKNADSGTSLSASPATDTAATEAAPTAPQLDLAMDPDLVVSPPPPPQGFIESAMGQIQSIMEMGGPVVVLLSILSVLSLTVILYKVWQFSWLGIGRHKRARKALLQWRQGQQVEAIDLLAKGKAPVSVVLLHAMRGQLFHPDKGALIREDVERVALSSLSKTRFLLRFLETVGQISPLLGLFGTVIGMIEAFQRLQQAGASVDPSVLAGGIWVALLTTAVGLAVAIPASLFADWFSSRVEREQDVIEELVTSVLTGQITDASSTPANPVVHGDLAYAT